MNNLKDYKKLKDVMPTELSDGCEYIDTKAYTMIDEYVLSEHGHPFEHFENELLWPGNQKNVYYWVQLSNGYAVGWNENPARGWSFPVVKSPYYTKMSLEQFKKLEAYYREKYKSE